MEIEKLYIQHRNKTLVDIAFSIDRSLALVGQSGSGKSLSLKALLGMLPDSMSLELKIDAPFRVLKGETLAFVPQNPFTALSPLTKIHKQFFASDAKIRELFDQVGLEYALCKRFPPELSGGQLQRVIIAMALSSNPKLLLLDEPTTALDPTNRTLIIELLKALQEKMGFKMLFVTHDMKSAESLCEDICVIKDGKIVEAGCLDEVLKSPKESYTQTLVAASFSNREFRA